MANTDPLIITIQTKFEDKTKGQVKEAKRNIEDLDASIKKLSKEKAEPTISLKDQAINKLDATAKRLEEIGSQVCAPTLSLKDTATAKITQAAYQVSAFGMRTASATLKATDYASSVIESATSKVKSLSSKAWDFTVRAIDKATSPLKRVYNWLTSIQGIATTLFAGAAFQKTVLDPISIADFYTTAEIGFTTMLGSAQKAKEMMDDINKFAIATPFEAQGLVDTSQKMLAMGWSAESILPDLEKIGNAMSAMGKGQDGIDRVTLALSQMRAKGKVSAEEMNQLTETGIAGWTYLANAMGVSTSEAQDMVSKGLIPVERAIDGIISGMSEFDGMMEETANKTASGLWSQIQESATVNIFKPWGEGLQDGVKPALEQINNLMDNIFSGSNNMSDNIKSIAMEISGAIGGAIAGVAKNFSEIFGRSDFQSATLGKKIEILMRDGVAKPIERWWNSGGKDTVTSLAKGAMSAVGSVIKEGVPVLIEAAFSNPVTGTIAASYGLKIASSFIGSLASGMGKTKSTISSAIDITKGIGSLKNVGLSGFTSAFKDAGSLTGALKKLGQESKNTTSTVGSLLSTSKDLTTTFKDAYKESGSLVSAFKTVQTTTSGAEKTVGSFKSALSAVSPVMLAVTAATWTWKAAQDNINRIREHAMDNYKEELDQMQKQIETTKNLVSSIKSSNEAREDQLSKGMLEHAQAKALTNQMFDLIEQENLSAQAKESVLWYSDQLNSLYPDLNLHYEEATNKLYDEEGAIYATRDALQQKIDKTWEAVKAQAALNLMQDSMSSYMQGMVQLPKARNDYDLAQQNYDEAKSRLDNLVNAGDMTSPELTAALEQVNVLKEKLDEAEQSYEDLIQVTSDSGKEIQTFADIAGIQAPDLLDNLDQSLIDTGVTSQEMSQTVRDAMTQTAEDSLTAGVNAGNNYAEGLASTKDNLIFNTDQTLNWVKQTADQKSQEIAQTGSKAGIDWVKGFKEAFNMGLSTIGNIGSYIGNAFPIGRIFGFGSHAEGGIMNEPHVGLVAEDGPEAIIPLGDKRRGRGIALWEEAGKRLGVYAHAEGGISDSPDVSAAGVTVKAQGVTLGADTDYSSAISDTNSFGVAYKASVDSILSVGKTSFSELASNTVDSFDTAEEGVENSLAGTVTSYLSFVENMGNLNVSMLTAYVANTQAYMNQATSVIQNTLNSQISMMNSFGARFRATGSALMGEFITGLESRKNEVLNSASTLVTQLKAKFEEGLGIHSPSRYAQWVGAMTIEGLIKGLSGSKLSQFVDSVVGDMRNSFANGKMDIGQLIAGLGDKVPDLITRINAVAGDMDIGSDMAMGYPLVGYNAPITSGFGRRKSPGGIGSTDHMGIDLGAPSGTPIASALPGTVTLAQYYGGYGNAVIVDHGNNLKTLYGHMSKIGSTKGQQVSKGQVIGYVGSTGNSTGPHLHWEVRTPNPVDPAPYLAGASVSVGDPLATAISNAYYGTSSGIASAAGSVDYDISAGASQWSAVALQALSMLGQPSSYLKDVLWMIQSESGGNPNSINNWDINAKRGDPSRGLVQTIGATFNAYRNPNLSANIYDPLSNIYAGLNYAIHRYKSLENLFAPRRSKWYGYATGTDYATAGLHWVGEEGPELVSFRGGEKVFTHDESMKLAQSQKASVPQARTQTSSSSDTNVTVSDGAVQVNISVNGNVTDEVMPNLVAQVREAANNALYELATGLKDCNNGIPINGGLA